MVVPFTVAAAPPAERIVPAIGNAEGLGVNFGSATVYALLGVYVRLGRSIVEPPIANAPDGPRLMVVPSIVTAEPPTEMVVPAIEKAEGFGVNVWPAIV